MIFYATHSDLEPDVHLRKMARELKVSKESLRKLVRWRLGAKVAWFHHRTPPCISAIRDLTAHKYAGCLLSSNADSLAHS